MYAVGYDGLLNSTGGVLDTPCSAMCDVFSDGKKFLDEDFMNKIFSKIDKDKNGSPQLVLSSVEATEHHTGT